MELLIPFSGLWAKNFFCKLYTIITKEFKIDFQNRKWNYSNRKWNYFFHFQISDQITSFTTSFPFLPRNSKLIFKTGNGLIQTGNGIISPTSRPLIKKLLLLNVSHLIQGVKNQISKLPSFWSKNFYFQIMNKLSEDGVNMQEGKLVRYKSFVSANECNSGQIVFLNQSMSFLVSRTVRGRVKMRIHGHQYQPTLHTNHNERIFKI